MIRARRRVLTVAILYAMIVVLSVVVAKVIIAKTVLAGHVMNVMGIFARNAKRLATDATKPSVVIVGIILVITVELKCAVIV